MAAFLAQGTGIRGCQMKANSPVIRLAICAENSFSHMRVSCGNPGTGKASHTRVWSVCLPLSKGPPDPPARRTHTRVCSGPSLKGRNISNEGPAQPALHRFGVGRKTTARLKFTTPLNWGVKAGVPRGRLAALQRLGLRQKGGPMRSA